MVIHSIPPLIYLPYRCFTTVANVKITDTRIPIYMHPCTCTLVFCVCVGFVGSASMPCFAGRQQKKCIVLISAQHCYEMTLITCVISKCLCHVHITEKWTTTLLYSYTCRLLCASMWPTLLCIRSVLLSKPVICRHISLSRHIKPTQASAWLHY